MFEVRNPVLIELQFDITVSVPFLLTSSKQTSGLWNLHRAWHGNVIIPKASEITYDVTV
jgi:hypothetical protein